MGRRKVELTGKRFSKLIVLKRAKSTGTGITRWLCKCDCGKAKIVRTGNLTSGNTKSCGCIRQKHGLSGNPLTNTYFGMIYRCHKPDSEYYKDYGGRGIKVCSRWRRSLRLYIKDILEIIGPKPSPTHSIDRINNDGNYEPGNIRWATPKEQAANSRPKGRHRRQPAVG